MKNSLFLVRINHNRMNILTGNGDVLRREWGCASLGMHILTENRDVPHGECTSSPGMGMCLTRNAYPHRECTKFIQGEDEKLNFR